MYPACQKGQFRIINFSSYHRVWWFVLMVPKKIGNIQGEKSLSFIISAVLDFFFIFLILIFFIWVGIFVRSSYKIYFYFLISFLFGDLKVLQNV